MKWVLQILFVGMYSVLYAQNIDTDLLKAKQRMDSIQQFSANLKLEVDINFINMPTKYATMNYTKGKPVKFSSTDFVMIPKRGLDFSMNRLFEYSFITVPRGEEIRKGVSYKAVNIIPTDKRADFSIALVLSLPDNEAKNILLVATYICVLFSILVQGLTVGKLAKYLG